MGVRGSMTSSVVLKINIIYLVHSTPKTTIFPEKGVGSLTVNGDGGKVRGNKQDRDGMSQVDR